MSWITIFGIIAFLFCALYNFFLFKVSRNSSIDIMNFPRLLVVFALMSLFIVGAFVVILLATKTMLWLTAILGIVLLVWFYFGYSYLFRKLTDFDKIINVYSGALMTVLVLVVILLKIF